MPLRTPQRHENSARHRRAAPAGAAARGLSCRLRAAAGALRRWWAEERHYRPERHYMRG